MVDVNKLRGIIVEKGLTGEKVAEMVGMSKKTFYLRMKEAKFNSDEMDKLIDILDIDDPLRIFFANRVT
jgi:transcriptional regulator with XRE-family HTH domain